MASVKWTAAELADQSGRTAVVTGASSGLGLAAAHELARAGARVVLAVRNTETGQRAAAGIPGRTEVRPLDLASLASVRAFAARWTGALDILVNNAGIMAVPEGRTVDGFELQIGINHLGPFLLTDLLLPVITDRVVTVSSQLHRRGRIDLDDLNWEHRRYNATGACNASKLANVLFTLELQRRLTEAGSRVRAVTAHPGIARTSLGNQTHHQPSELPAAMELAGPASPGFPLASQIRASTIRPGTWLPRVIRMPPCCAGRGLRRPRRPPGQGARRGIPDRHRPGR